MNHKNKFKIVLLSPFEKLSCVVVVERKVFAESKMEGKKKNKRDEKFFI